MDFVLMTSSPGRRSVANCSVHPAWHHFSTLFLPSPFGEGNIQWSQPSHRPPIAITCPEAHFKCSRNISLLSPLSLGTFFSCFSCFIAVVYSATVLCWDSFFLLSAEPSSGRSGTWVQISGKPFIFRIMQCCHTHHCPNMLIYLHI